MFVKTVTLDVKELVIRDVKLLVTLVKDVILVRIVILDVM